MSKLAWIAGTMGAAVLGMPLIVGWRARSIVAAPGEAPVTAADTDRIVLQQHLQRIAMTTKALPKADMDRAIVTAAALKLPKTAATLRSILVDGKPGGPTYVGLPIDEYWPGTKVSVRRFISDAMNALKQQAVA